MTGFEPAFILHWQCSAIGHYATFAKTGGLWVDQTPASTLRGESPITRRIDQKVEPTPRIELGFSDYKTEVLPLNYEGWEI